MRPYKLTALLMSIALLSGCPKEDAEDPSASGSFAERLVPPVSDFDEQAQDAAGFAYDLAILASNVAQSQGLTVSGTVTLRGQNATYVTTPADRLVAVFEDDALTVAVTYYQISGDFGSDDGEDFVDRNHQLDVTVVMKGFDARIASSRSGTNYSRRIAGRLQGDDDGEPVDVDVDLTFAGVYSYSNSGSYLTNDHDYLVTGTIAAGGDSYEINMSREFSLSGGLDSGYFTSWRTVRNGSATLDGTRYSWHDAVISYSQLDGKARDVGNWQGSGELRRDGAAYGQLVLEPYPADAGWQFVLILPDDERIELVSLLN